MHIGDIIFMMVMMMIPLFIIVTIVGGVWYMVKQKNKWIAWKNV